MIKTICFDLGGDRELSLTIDEIIKLQAAFRFVCVDKYTEPAKPLTPFGEEYARALKFREKRGLEGAGLGDIKYTGGLSVTTEELEQQMQEQFHRMRNGL